jgi:spore coat protein U-like protein
MRCWALRTFVMAALAAVGAWVSTQAATSTSTLTVNAVVSANCSISSGVLSFGSYDPVVVNASTPLDGSGTFTVACTKNAANVWIGIGYGSNVSGSTRRMKDAGTNYVTYELYRDAARTSIWGNVQASGVSYAPTTKAATTFTVYGRMPANQDAAAGSYTDTVQMTVNF